MVGHLFIKNMNNSSIYSTIRSFLRNNILNLLGSFSTPKAGIHILNAHRIEKETDPEAFRHLLTELSKYVTFVRVETAVDMIKRHEKPSKPIVAFTFDDGFLECYDYFAPILEEFAVNAMFFVNPNYVEGDDNYIENFNNNIVMTPGKQPMRWNHLKELSERGHIIAAHTMDHFMINCEDEKILKIQIKTCKKVIEDHIGKPCEYFAFPYGRLSQANNLSIDIACDTYPYVFSQSDYKHYFSFGNRVINRRHFEPFWPKKHLFYFLSCNKHY